jgi:cathepsin F
MLQHGKSYDSVEEYNRRFQTYQDNLERIDELNGLYSPKTKFGVNKFADLSKEEFKNTYLSKNLAVRDDSWPVAPDFSDEVIENMPSTFDWRPKGAVTAVKDQGQCGSCWSFSTTGNVEGQWFLAGHTLIGLSEQNLVDCDQECMEYEGESVCDAGCDGGLMPNAFTYIMKTGGIDTESSYPYEGIDDTCRYNSKNDGASISNFTLLSTNETQIAAYLAIHGPVSIAADAEEWQFYIEGVFYLPCGTQLDHGILLVGYGSETDVFDQTMPFWIVKNSWGQDWGESGYLRVERGVGECGLNLFACSSIIDA